MSKTRIKTPELGPGSHRIRVRVDIDGQQAFDIDEEVTSAEVNISSPVTELPSDTLTKGYTDVKTALPKAITDANAFLAKAMTMSQTLKKFDLTMTVPAPVK